MRLATSSPRSEAISRFEAAMTSGETEMMYSLEMLFLRKVCATANPIPRLPPVMTPTFPVRSGQSVSSNCRVPSFEAGPPKFSAIVF
jgi:hypothetical protein